MDYPPEISTFTVTGKLMYGNPDTADAGIAPDLEPVRGAGILFEPEMSPPIYDAPAAATVIYQRAVSASTDVNGNITGLLDSTPDVMLPYYPGRTWRVTIEVPDFPIQVFSITGSPGGTVNIASVVPVPPDPGTDIIAWEAVTAEVLAARDAAVAAAVAAAASNPGVPNGTATLDASTKLTPAQIPTHLTTAAIASTVGRSVAVVPEQSQAQIQAVLDATPAQTRIVFAPGTYALTSALVVKADGTHIDALSAKFTQATWGAPAFDLIGRNDCLLDIGMVEFVGTRGPQGTSVRGSASYVSTAGVWANGDRTYIRNLRTKGMVCGVFFSSWNGTGTYDRKGESNRVGKLESEGYDFAVLWSAQKNLVIDDVFGHDDIDDSAGANPTHIIYGSAITTYRDEAVTIRSVRGVNHLYGQPVQAKYSDRFSLRSVSLSGCKGAVNLMDCHDLDIDGVSSVGTLANGGAGAFTMQSTNLVCQRPQVRNVSIVLAANVDERGFLAISDDGVYANVTVQSEHSSGVVTTTGDINIRGSRNRFSGTKNVQVGTPVRGIIVGFGSSSPADGTIIDRPVITGATAGVVVQGGTVNAVVDYDPTAQTIAAGGEFLISSGGSGAETYSTRSRRAVSLSTFGENASLNLLAASGTVTVGAVNSAIQKKIRPNRDITVSGLRWWSASAAGNYDLGIFEDSSGKRLWSKGTTAWPAAGVINETVTGVVLKAGRTYRIAFAGTDATATLRGITAVIAGLDVSLDGNTDSTTVSSAFPLPDPLVAGTAGSTTRHALVVVIGS